VFDIDTFRKTLNTNFIGKSDIVVHDEVSSTNDIAIAHAENGDITQGTLIIAEHQTAGRGRYGRTWQAPHGKCILATVIFKHRLKQQHVHLPNLIGALSIAQGINEITELHARIKHPNDVRIAEKKVAGVLTELKYDKHHHPFFVLGFGVNVNISMQEFPIELHPTATSLQLAISNACETEISRIKLLQSILCHLEKNYLLLKSGNISAITEQVKLWEEK